jgi:hypothetical protein
MVTRASDDSASEIIREAHLSVRAAAAHFGYCEQYLRRLLRVGRLEGVKVGQVWLIRLASLEHHLGSGQAADDCRFGPQEIALGASKEVSA